ncbi:hypothetical protein Tco_0421702 [Tanacetum coccineum]
MESKDQKTLLVSESGEDNDRRHVPVSSPMTRKGVYAAVSYMACADSSSVSEGTTSKAVVQPDLTNLPEKSRK